MLDETRSVSIERRAFVGTSWLALFRFSSQLFSWTATILVARMLQPSDYGLMEMAVIIPGYALKMSELGLGPAIIQRAETTQHELSSMFWFGLLIACLLSGTCYAVGPVVAEVFREPRLVVLVQTISVLFLLQGVQVVPNSLLRKRLDFKKLGQIEILSAVVSSLTVLFIARLGGGVWALISGFVALSSAQLIFTFAAVKWLPGLHYRFDEVRPYLKFGLLISLQGTLFYVYEKADKFFAARAWQPFTLGQYSMALQLAQLPTEKITVLINNVSFPTFVLLKPDRKRFADFYLSTVNTSAILVFPVFVGGFMVGADLVRMLLSEKWASIGRIFEFLCLAQIPVSLNAVNNFVHNASGRASWSTITTALSAALLSISFFVAVPYGLEAALIPWFTTNVLLAAVWIVITTRTIGIPLRVYLKRLSVPFAATVAMATAIQLVTVLGSDYLRSLGLLGSLMTKCGVGAVVYLTLLWVYDRRVFSALRSLWRR